MLLLLKMMSLLAVGASSVRLSYLALLGIQGLSPPFPLMGIRTNTLLGDRYQCWFGTFTGGEAIMTMAEVVSRTVL